MRADVPLLIFDGECRFCTWAAHFAQRRFRCGERAVAWQSLSPETLAAYELTVADVRAAAWWIDAVGTRERGHRAVGRALRAGGAWRGFLGWLCLRPPGSWLAAALYRIVVRVRAHLPGVTPACARASTVGGS